ncbi:gliding motility-associated C-terminal domain-containing protein [Aurantibacillus circumpalustris]|uniref:gliding motility-associated C-terminal domain-containing protein n=1 Tax=Aurantibacillus circumpalustris TaxID=3036359 RepID=UPI00295B3086|nr:gliding motility-associated C-terminal domain-containing protein [Aurantibacillus circumpalustris]
MRKLLAFVFVFVSLYSEFQAQSICGGSSYTIVPTTTITGTPSYTLNPGNFSPNGNGNFVVSPGSTTSYTLLSSSGSATASSVITVTVNPQPSSNPSFTQATCTNSFNAVNLGLTFSPATPPPAYTLSWTPIPANLSSPQQFTTTNLTPGPYSVVVTAGSCSLVIDFTINPQPAPAIYSVIPFGGIYSITCVQQTLELIANNPNNTYTWTGASFLPVQSESISLNATHLGTLSVIGQNTVSGCTKTYTFLLAQNISNPTASLSTNLINITCLQASAPTLTAIATPSINVTHKIYSPQGGTFSATSYTTIYSPGGPGTYTHVIVDDANGCSSQRTFTVATNDNYPTFSVSSLNNFTLGCNTKSVITIDIVGAATTPTAGGPVSYSFVLPGGTVTVPTGTTPLSGTSSNTNVSTPGTWTLIVKDNTNFCETQTQVSVLLKNTPPNIGAIVPNQILDCNVRKVIVEGVSETQGVGYLWNFVPPPGSPNSIASNTISVLINTVAPTTTLINTYTLTITDINNTCKSTSLIPMYQNTFPPTASITSGGSNSSSLTCLTPTIVLTNQSKTSIPANSVFTTNSLVIGYVWEGPSPQEPLQLSSTYTAGTVGMYTLTAKDLNNGCIASGTYSVIDNRRYPEVDAPPAVKKDYTIDCGSNFTTLAPTILPGSGLTYSWSGAGVVGNNDKKTFDVTAPGNYSVVVTNTINGCVTKEVYKAITGSLTAVLGSDVESGYAPLTVNFSNKSYSSLDSSNVFGLWSYGNGSISGITTGTVFVPGPISATVASSAKYTQAGTYTVVMFAKKGACIDTAYKVIKVELPSSLVIPNVFTPNGDGINDLFFLKATNLSSVDMTIVDRWGRIVYELVSESGNIEWDGKNAEGNDAAEGVYFYVIKTTGKDGVTNDKKGTINLYR